MSIATFKDLCLDANDPAVVADFWAAALGLNRNDRPDGMILLTGPSPQHTLWINQVAEPKTAKHRVHLDVHGSSAQVLEALGASVIDDTSFRWTVMADPEGGEFCLFPRDTLPEYRLYEVVFGCADHARTSTWWSALIGGERVADERGFSYIEAIPNAPFETLSFVPVDEAKVIKNRIHLDVVSADLGAILASGATLLRGRDDEIEWDVLGDPEGNEFCVFAPA